LPLAAAQLVKGSCCQSLADRDEGESILIGQALRSHQHIDRREDEAINIGPLEPHCHQGLDGPDDAGSAVTGERFCLGVSHVAILPCIVGP